MGKTDRTRLEALLQEHHRRLHLLKLQEAQYGSRVDPQVLIEIEDIGVEIARIEERLGKENIDSNGKVVEARNDNVALSQPWINYLALGTIGVIITLSIGLAWWFAFRGTITDILYSSDFERDLGEWLIESISDSNGTLLQTIVDGRYRWELTSTDQRTFRQAIPKSSPIITDSVLQVEVKPLNGTMFYGLLFRYTGKGYYIFWINGNNFCLNAQYDREPHFIIDCQPSPFLKQREVNTLKVITQGSKISLYINGNLVGQADDKKFSSGKVGIHVRTSPNSQDVYEFDNFQLSRQL